MSAPSSSLSDYWQRELQAHCQKIGLPAPVFHIISDRRGGRTAWSSFVELKVANVSSPYWFDGEYTNNAKEAAAEAALKWLQNPSMTPTFYTGPGAPPTTNMYARNLRR
ncbi:hypothetical protein HFD88_005796 [Aspergillus terreus]|nr:hypothetical protein HFD88_005796 [Aspergillus terreus]